MTRASTMVGCAIPRPAALWLILVLGLVPRIALAQSAPTDETRPYLGAALLLSTETAGTYPSGEHWHSEPLSGSALGASVFMDAPVNRFVGIGVEVSGGTSISGSQSQGAVQTASFLRTQHHLLLSVLARFNPRQADHHLSVQPVIGLSLAHEATEDDHVVITNPFSPGIPA
ncbi:MAG: hypothetical protein ACRD3J_07115, partial [Thermoanaerobaculia bacterium]